MWATHELGHAFNLALSPNNLNGNNKGQGYIELATTDELFADIDGDGIKDRLAGGCTLTTYEVESCYTRETGIGSGYRQGRGSDGNYLQNDYSNVNEDFADMFSNYVFNSFDTNQAGIDRYNWMHDHMLTWINLAIANNQ